MRAALFAPALFAVMSLAALTACGPDVTPPAAAPPVAPPPAAPPASTPPPLATTPDEPFRAHKPPPLPSDPAFSPPVPVQRTLRNGAQLLVVENHSLPLVAVEIAVQAGVDREPLDRRGLSGFVAEMLLEGTTTRTSLELEVARERIAARLSTGSGLETTALHLNALRDTLPDALALLADVLEHPAFRPEDIDRKRGLLLTSLAAKKGNPSALARDDLARRVWGDKNAWGLPSGGTPESLKAITARELARFHQTYFVPSNAVIAVSGDITVDDAVAALDRALGGWKGGKVAPRKPLTFPAPGPRSIDVTDLPTGTQSQVWVGWRGPKPTAPEMLPLMVANGIIGGLFSSRLNLNLREQKAFSYGVSSSFALTRDVSSFRASGGIVAAHTAEAVTEFEKELSRLKTDPITDDELSRAKEDLVRSLPSQLETNDAVASAVAALVELGRPLDYYATLPGKIRAIQKADVVAAIGKFFDAEHWPVAVVGPKAQSFEGLKALGLGEVREVMP